MSRSETSFPKAKHSSSGSSFTTSDPGEGRKSDDRASSLNPPDVREKLDNNEFIVERIMGYRQMNKIRYARVKWLGYPETTWEPADGIFLYQPSHKNGRKGREAHALVGRRIKKGKVEYKVNWVGFPPSCDCWVRESTLNRKDLVDKYMDEFGVELSAKSVQKRPRKKRSIADVNGIPSPLKVADDLPDRDDTLAAGLFDFEQLGSPDSQASMPSELKNKSQASDQKDSVKEELISTPPSPPPPPPASQPVPVVIEISRLPMESKPIEEWTDSDLYDYLTHKSFPDAANKLRDRNIDGKQLLSHLTPIDMRKLAIPVGPSLKIAKLIRDLRGSLPAV